MEIFYSDEIEASVAGEFAAPRRCVASYRPNFWRVGRQFYLMKNVNGRIHWLGLYSVKLITKKHIKFVGGWEDNDKTKKAKIIRVLLEKKPTPKDRTCAR